MCLCVSLHPLQLRSPAYEDLISPLKAITEQPFWIPSQSLQLKMVTHAHTLIEVLNQVCGVCMLFWGLGAQLVLLRDCRGRQQA